jgi:uncharacterized protein YjlB
MKPIRKKYTLKHFYVRDNGIFPNSVLPVLHYSNVLDLPLLFPAKTVEALFDKNNWGNFQKSGVFKYHHYHSNTHEVMAVIKGETELVLGGDGGTHVKIRKGDVLIIPAGVAHKNLGDQNQLTCILAYPDGKSYDMKYGESGERPKADQSIRSVPVPENDPVFGADGVMFNNWKLKQETAPQ